MKIDTPKEQIMDFINRNAEQGELEHLAKLMEEMAVLPRDGSPPVRQPGERCSYEIQRMENVKAD